MKKTFVTFLSPGIMFPEYETVEVLSRDIDELDIPDNVYAFHFFDRIEEEIDGVVLKSEALNESPRYLYNGRVMSRSEIMVEVPNNKILLSNMESNGWYYMFRSHLGNFQPIWEDDIIVGESDER